MWYSWSNWGWANYGLSSYAFWAKVIDSLYPLPSTEQEASKIRVSAALNAGYSCKHLGCNLA